MAKTGIILASHGYFAKEALASAEMIIGHAQENVAVVSITPEKDYDFALAEIKEVYSSLDQSQDVLILTDIYGGTPSNIATYLAIENENVTVYSGFNLPILLDVLLQREASMETLKETIEATYKIGLTNISEQIERGQQDVTEVDSY